MTHRIRGLAAVSLGWSLMACSSAGELAEEPVDSPEGALGTLAAELRVGESTIEFWQIDGGFVVSEAARQDAPRILTPEMHQQPLGELHRQLAPQQKVPEPLLRWDQEQLEAAQADLEAGNGPHAGELPEQLHSVPPEAGLAGKNQWFVDNFCGFSGNDNEWCVLNATGSGSATRVHRTQSYWHAAAGSDIRVKFQAGSSVKGDWIVSLGTVRSFYWHNSHSWTGYANESKVWWLLSENAGDTVNVSAWFVNNDDFICGPGC